MTHCSHCGGPVGGSGLAGRPWPGRAAAAAAYCCYGCLSLGEADRQADAGPRRGMNLGARLAAALLVAGQSMIFGLALNLHDDVPADVRHFVQALLLGATAVVFALLGGPLVRAAWAELRHGRITLEALFLVTASGASAASVQALVTGRGAVYFEVVSILLVVYALGKVVGARARAAALAGAHAWAGQLATARIVDAAGRARTVPVAEVIVGDVVEVNPGETVPVDGVIRAGVGFVSEAPVSGEPFAVVRRPGDHVLAGVAAHDATFRVEATAAGTERQVDRLLAAVAAARDTPLSLQHRADRISGVFVPLVVVVAALTFGYWAFLTPAGWEAALFHAMSVLLVACPCVLGLATPVVVWSVLGRLAERGLVVRSGDAVERLAAVDVVLLDKTGTLTDEQFSLVDVETACEGEERAELLGWVALVEERSKHPVAAPFARLPKAAARVENVTVVPGCGVEADVVADGVRHALRVGRPGWVGGFDVGQASSLPSPARQAGSLPHATHRVAVSVDGELAAIAVVAERLRDSAADALAAFDRLALPVEVLTGDTAARAAALGLPAVTGGMLPADKLERVRALTTAGRAPLMVGDGLNDAAALAAAHAGIALASGTDLAVAAADATLYHGDLRVLPWAVELCRAAVRAVRLGLAAALAYNVVGVALAAAGLLHPVAAVLLMVVSSVTMVAFAARVRPGCAVERNAASGWGRGGVHGAAVALQGVFVALLLGMTPAVAALTVGVATFLGGAAAAWWVRRPTLGHGADMAFGMVTVGNLGMLAGWFADAGFAPPACAHCGSGAGMWIGMLLAANAAMRWLGRRSLPRGHHAAAMFSGGNVGMLLGMAAGGQLAADAGLMAAFAAMTLGMVGGMLAGTWLAERLLGAMRRRRSPPEPAPSGVGAMTSVKGSDP